jgi:8-oxo-dGTP diphosphatase
MPALTAELDPQAGLAGSPRRGFPPMGVRESRNPRASPSGHLERGESIPQAAVRETFEETGITLDPAMLRHVLSIHQRNTGTADTRIGLAFSPTEWDGEPVIAESHEHSELVWTDPAALPPDTAEYTAAVITAAERGLTFTLNGW